MSQPGSVEPETLESSLEAKLEDRLQKNEILSRLAKLEENSKIPKKDFWDRMDSISVIISGVLVALIGFYATNIYDKRVKDAEQLDKDRSVVAIELQTVEKFFPHLASNNEQEKQAAIQAISSLANPQLAAKIATVFGGSGARAAITNIVSSGSPQTQSSVTYALTDLFKGFGNATGALYVKGQQGGSDFNFLGTCVIITQDGYALTAGHFFSQPSENTMDLAVSVGSLSAPRQKAILITVRTDLDLALIKLSSASAYNVHVRIATDPLQLGAAVTVLGYPLGHSLTVSTGLVESASGPDGRLTINTILAPGSSGSPIFNSRGEMVGIIVAGTQTSSIGLPIQSTRPLLQLAGIL